jgi:nitrile hydratase
VRTPAYIRGKTGWVETLHGRYRNPESLAYGGEGLPKQALYGVGFKQTDLWPEYRGSPADSVYVDIYEHWLED